MFTPLTLAIIADLKCRAYCSVVETWTSIMEGPLEVLPLQIHPQTEQPFIVQVDDPAIYMFIMDQHSTDSFCRAKYIQFMQCYVTGGDCRNLKVQVWTGNQFHATPRF
ncbi:hypothetical protein AMECASPLE_024335 [Ameca splendens]|uniref:Uncharacterized protein n=1 Tax=Ameca splendens TaxID=208324 RepID=A0ABV1ACA9_9TELE